MINGYLALYFKWLSLQAKRVVVECNNNYMKTSMRDGVNYDLIIWFHTFAIVMEYANKINVQEQQQ